MSAPSAPGVSTLRALVARATLAPSTRNAQPWRWTVHPDHAELELDPEVGERLALNDPEHRELVISCGAALLTFRVAAAQALFDATIDVLPDPHRPDLLACVTVEPGTVDAAFATLDDVVPLRRTAWAAFDDRPLPDGLADRLASEAAVEGARLDRIGPADREAVADLLEHADRDRYDDPERRAELAGWITSRWADEGRVVATAAVVPARAAVRHLHLGDRIAAHDGELLRQAPFIAVLATAGDTRTDWIAAGQALQRVLLVAAEHGISGGFLNAPCQVEADRERLRALLPGADVPQLVLRLGHPLTRAQGTARRPVDDVITVHDGPDDVHGVDAPHDGSEITTPRDAGADFSEDSLG
jgi:nitroreductase